MEQRNQLNQYSSPQSKKSRTVARAPMGWASWLAVVLMVVSTMPGCGNQAENERLAGDSPTLSPSLDNPDFAWQSFLEQGCNALLHAKDPAAAIAYFEEAESVVEAAGLDERLQDLPVLKLARRAKKEGMKGDFPMEDFYWEAARQKDLPTGYLAYLQQFPEGKFAGEARRKMGQ